MSTHIAKEFIYTIILFLYLCHLRTVSYIFSFLLLPILLLPYLRLYVVLLKTLAVTRSIRERTRYCVNKREIAIILIICKNSLNYKQCLLPYCNSTNLKFTERYKTPEPLVQRCVFSCRLSFARR